MILVFPLAPAFNSVFRMPSDVRSRSMYL